MLTLKVTKEIWISKTKRNLSNFLSSFDHMIELILWSFCKYISHIKESIECSYRLLIILVLFIYRVCHYSKHIEWDRPIFCYFVDSFITTGSTIIEKDIKAYNPYKILYFNITWLCVCWYANNIVMCIHWYNCGL